MSGGGGSGAETWSPEGAVGDCHALVFEAVITSPQMDVVTSLVLQELLDVVLESSEDVRMIALRREGGGQLVGTLTSGRLMDLLRCLQEGVEFVSEVLSIEGSVVRVNVHARS